MAKPNKDDSRELLDGLLARVKKGDAVAYDALKRAPVEVTNLPNRIAHAGNIAVQAERSIIKMMYGDDLIAIEGTTAKLAAIRSDLAGGEASPLERLLVERIVMCWLNLYAAEANLAQNRGELSRQWTEQYERRIDRTHTRYLSAIRTLAVVRRLHLPTVQVNIADKQVNLTR